MKTELGRALLHLARRAISEALAGLPPPAELPGGTGPPAELLAPGATFVTLTAGGELRGCIGTLEARRPLWRDVWQNAFAAAFRDPRFPPLSAAELPGIEIEVSLLSPPEALPAAVENEEEVLAALRPGVDGLVLEWGRHRATFLPQVWDPLPRPRDFLAQLKRKAGLEPDFWAPDIELRRYTVTHWREGDLAAP